jgi:hemerythrin superfamily protein
MARRMIRHFKEMMMAEHKIEARSQGSFPMDDPTQGLLHDHQFVRQLMQRYLSTQDQRVKQYAGPRICEALLQHTRLEEAVFYPAVEKLNVAMVTRCLDDHHAADELIEQIQNLLPGDSAYDDLIKQLNDATQAHMEIEEQQLFPLVRQSSLNLQDLALRMQSFESSMVSAQAKNIGQRTARGDQLH